MLFLVGEGFSASSTSEFSLFKCVDLKSAQRHTFEVLPTRGTTSLPAFAPVRYAREAEHSFTVGALGWTVDHEFANGTHEVLLELGHSLSFYDLILGNASVDENGVFLLLFLPFGESYKFPDH